MRVIMLALILANVLFFMWSTWVAEPPVEVPHRQAGGVPELRLMSELDNPAVAPALAAVAMQYVISEPETGTPAGLLLKVDETALAPMLELPEDASETPPATSEGVKVAAIEAADAVAEDDGSVQQPDAQSAAAPEAETGSAGLPAAAPEQPAASEVVDEIPAAIKFAAARLESRCASLGPYLNLREATEAASRLRAAGLAPRQRLSEEQVWVGHWVYLPSFASRDEAVEAVERLRAEGVKDIYIEPRGDRENAVSLGLFSDRENAELYAGQVRQFEVRPQITDRYRFGSAYWVDITLPANQPFDVSAYQRDAVRQVRLEEGSCADRESGESDPVD